MEKRKPHPTFWEMGKRRRCTKCKKLKSIGCFYLQPVRKDGIDSKCKKCRLEGCVVARKKRLGTPEGRARSARQERGQRLKMLYGISVEDYDRLYSIQSGKCAICEKCPQENSRWKSKGYSILVVDHDHETGEIRELLCPKCNAGLGCFDDSIEIFQKAIGYLKKHLGISSS